MVINVLQSNDNLFSSTGKAYGQRFGIWGPPDARVRVAL